MLRRIGRHQNSGSLRASFACTRIRLLSQVLADSGTRPTCFPPGSSGVRNKTEMVLPSRALVPKVLADLGACALLEFKQDRALPKERTCRAHAECGQLGTFHKCRDARFFLFANRSAPKSKRERALCGVNLNTKCAMCWSLQGIACSSEDGDVLCAARGFLKQRAEESLLALARKWGTPNIVPQIVGSLL